MKGASEGLWQEVWEGYAGEWERGYRQPKRMTSEITSYTRKYVSTLLLSSTEYLMVLQ